MCVFLCRRCVVCIVTSNFEKMQRRSAWNLERGGWQADKEKICSIFKSTNYQVTKIVNQNREKIFQTLNTIGYSESKGIIANT